jgi:hypothetical protein
MYLRKVAYQLEARVQSLVPCFHKSHLKNLALMVVGIACVHSANGRDFNEFHAHLLNGHA